VGQYTLSVCPWLVQFLNAGLYTCTDCASIAIIRFECLQILAPFQLSEARLLRSETLDKSQKFRRLIQQLRANVDESLDLVFFERKTRRQG